MSENCEHSFSYEDTGYTYKGLPAVQRACNKCGESLYEHCQSLTAKNEALVEIAEMVADGNFNQAECIEKARQALANHKE